MGDSQDFSQSGKKISAEILKCEHLLTFRERDLEDKPIVYHRKCGKPAARRTIAGTLTSVRAVLCDQHAAHADYQSAVSTTGYPLGKIDKDARAAGHRQERLPGTGVQK